MPKKTRIPRRPRGAALLMVVFTLVALGAIGATVGNLTSTTFVEQPQAVPARQAFYAAEAGVRLVTAEYNNTSATSDRVGMLGDIDGKTFVLDQGTGEQFTMNIFSYGFRVTDVDSSVSPPTITAKAVQNVPLRDMEDASSSTTIGFPAGSKISVQDEIGNDYPVTLASAAQVTHHANAADTLVFSVDGTLPPASADLDYVNIAYDSDDYNPTASGDTVSGLPSGLANFPPRNGRIGFQGSTKAYTYRTRTVEENGTVTLSGVEATEGSLDISDFRNSTIILRKTFAFQSVGSIGTGSDAATKTLVYYDAPTDSASAIDPDADAEGPTITMRNLSDFNQRDLYVDLGYGRRNDIVQIDSYQADQGDHVYYAAMYSSNTGSGSLTNHVLRLDVNAFADSWAVDERLSYDVQIKVGTGYLLPYGALGLCIRHHRQTTANSYNFYGISFMKYYTRVRNGNRWEPNYDDHIPDGLKPSGMGTTTYRWDGWLSRYHDINETDKILLVFWRQEGNQQNWIAYKDVTDDLGIAPKQWWGDGRIVNDNATLMVRAEEQYVQGIKVNRIKVFYGDAATSSNIPRNPTAKPYDIVAGVLHSYNNFTLHDNARKCYAPEWTDDGADIFPSFPPYTIGDWTVTNDFFSFIEYGPGYTVNGSTRLCQWDATNDAVIAANPDADIRILSDGGTIRTREFLSPTPASDYDASDFPANRAEVALHAFGDMDTANEAATFDDLSIRFLRYID